MVAKVTDKVSIFATGDYTTNLEESGDKRRILEGNLGIESCPNGETPPGLPGRLHMNILHFSFFVIEFSCIE